MMKTEKILNDSILKITMNIRENYPELSKYITEMPVSIPDEMHPDVNLKKLEDYYDSLLSILQKYDVSHAPSDEQ